MTAKDQIQKAVTLYNQGNIQEAFKYFDMAIKMDPYMPEAYEARGDAYFKLKKYTEAIKDYNNACYYNSPNADTYKKRAKAYEVRVDAYLKSKEYDKAIEDYNTADYYDHSTNPPKYYHKKIAVVYYERAIVHIDNKSYDAAKDDLNKALEFDPTYAPAYFRRGVVYAEAIKYYDVAIVNYYAAIYFEPNNAEYYFWRGKCYYDLGETEKANADFAMAKKLGYWK